MSAHRKDRHLTGSYQPSRDPPKLAYVRPPPGELSAEQKTLLRLRPRSLPQRQKLAFRRAVIDAPWLTPGDLDMLLVWVGANDRYRTASIGLHRCLSDPSFALNPTPAMTKSFMTFNRLAHNEAMTVISVGHKLGFSPAARISLGVSTKPSPPADESDPWTALRLIPGGRPGDVG